MKKKLVLILAIIITLLIITISYLLISENNEANKNKNELNSTKEIEEDYSKYIFGKYYKETKKDIEKMSLEEKIGQLFLVRYDSNLVDSYIKNYHAGGFILFAKDFQNHTKESIKQGLNHHLKTSKYPLIYAVDEEGGYVTRVSKYLAFRESKFLSPKDYFEQGGYELLEKTEREKAQLLLSLGINLNLAPVADISTNEDDFIYNRSFGHNANETSLFIKHMVHYANEENISSCLKHFPGYGNNLDTHTGVAIDNRNYENFVENDYLPFISGIEEKVPCILVSHNIITSIDPEYPSSLSKKVITGELREKLHYTGIVITDDLDMDAVTSYAENKNAATLAINAGADLIITSDFVNMYKELLQKVKDGSISEDTIDYAVQRILSWKKAYKLY